MSGKHRKDDGPVLKSAGTMNGCSSMHASAQVHPIISKVKNNLPPLALASAAAAYYTIFFSGTYAGSR